MKLYIAGPMRGIPEFNFPAFYEAQHLLESAGYKCFSPAQKDVQRGFQFRGTTGYEEQPAGSGFNIREVMQIDTEWICREADGIALLDGWQNSKGARAEKALADCLGLPVKLVNQWLQIDVTAAEETMTDTVTESDPLENWDKAVVITQGDDNRLAKADYTEGQEVRIVNKTTGGEKGQKLARFDLIPAGPLWKVAELYGRGAQKYADRNWEKGYAWSLSYGALQRHLFLFWQGESLDQETRCHHLTSVVFHAFALMQFEEQHPELDDRPLHEGDWTRGLTERPG